MTNQISATAAWPNYVQSVAEIGQCLQLTMDRVTETVPVDFAWHAPGSDQPLAEGAAALKGLIEGGAWRSGDGEIHPENGYRFAVVGWDKSSPGSAWSNVVSIIVHAGNQVATGERWANSVVIECGYSLDKEIVYECGANAFRALIENWPSEWASLRSSHLRRVLGVIANPGIGLGYLTWVSHRLAPVPELVPHAIVSTFHDGSLITMNELNLDNPGGAEFLDAEVFLRTNQALPDIPRKRLADGTAIYHP